jgi:transposase IS481 family protein
MPTTALFSPQLHLFSGDSPTALDALARYETVRPILQGQGTLLQQSHLTGLPNKRLWRDLQRFRRDGLYGLLDHRTLPHRRGKTPIEAQVAAHIQQQIVRLAFAYPFTAPELARMVQTCHAIAVDHRGIRWALDRHHLPPDALRQHHEALQQAHLPPFAAGQQLLLALEPTTHAQRLAQALGPDHLLLRFRTYREYPTEEQARWRIIELLEVGFRPPGGWHISWPASRRLRRVPAVCRLGLDRLDHADSCGHRHHDEGLGPGSDGGLPAPG